MHRPAPPGVRVVHQPEAAEVDLALHPRLAVRDPQRDPLGPEAALLTGEPVQRAVGHDDTLTFELAVDVRQLQISLHPDCDLRLPQHQLLPRAPVSGRPCRPDRQNHRPDQLIAQLPLTALPQQPRRLAGFDIPARGLAIHTGPLRRDPMAGSCEPGPQHLPNFVHTNLPKRHPMPPRRWT